MTDIPTSSLVPQQSQYGRGDSAPKLASLFDDVASFLIEQRAQQRQRPALYVVAAGDLEEPFPSVRAGPLGDDSVKGPRIKSGTPNEIVRPVLQGGRDVLRPSDDSTRDIEPTGKSLIELLRTTLKTLQTRADDDRKFQLLLFLPGDQRPQRYDGRRQNPDWLDFEFRSGVVSNDLDSLLTALDAEQAADAARLDIDAKLIEWQRRLDAQPAGDAAHYVFATPLDERELRRFRATEDLAQRADRKIDEPQDCLLFTFDDDGLRVDQESFGDFGRRLLPKADLGVDLEGLSVDEAAEALRNACKPPNLFYERKDEQDTRVTGCYEPNKPLQALPAVCACLNILRTAPAVGMATFQPSGDPVRGGYRGEYVQKFDVDSRRQLLDATFDADAPQLKAAPCPPRNGGCPRGWSPPQCANPAPMCFRPDYAGPTALRDFVVDALRLFGPERRVALFYHPGTCSRDRFDPAADVVGDALDLIRDDALLPDNYRQRHREAMERASKAAESSENDAFDEFARKPSAGGGSKPASGAASGDKGNGDGQEESLAGLPGWAIGLIVGGALLLLLALVAGVVYALRRRRQQQQLAEGFGGAISMRLPAQLQQQQQPYAPFR